MTEIKGKTSSPISLLFLIVFGGIIIYQGYEKFGLTQSILIAFIILILYWMFTYPGHYHFKIENSSLYVGNALNPVIGKHYLFLNIKQFKQVRATFYGNAIQIIFKDGKIKTYPVNIKRLELEKIVQELNSELKTE